MFFVCTLIASSFGHYLCCVCVMYISVMHCCHPQAKPFSRSRADSLNRLLMGCAREHAAYPTITDASASEQNIIQPQPVAFLHRSNWKNDRPFGSSSACSARSANAIVVLLDVAGAPTNLSSHRPSRQLRIIYGLLLRVSLFMRIYGMA